MPGVLRRCTAGVGLLGLLSGTVAANAAGPAPHEGRRLPTGLLLDPVSSSIALGSMPLAMVFSPDSTHIVALLCGYREQGLQVVDLETRQVTQTLLQPAAFLGLAFSPDGRMLYASGGNQDVIYRYSWNGTAATLVDSLRLGPDSTVGQGIRYPAGIAFSPDGRTLYVAENLADSLACIDVASGRVVQRVGTGRYPCAVVVGPDGRVYVSEWGGDAIDTFAAESSSLSAGPRIVVGHHPSDLALNRAGTRLFAVRSSYDRIVVVDTQRGTVVSELRDTPRGAPAEGSTPEGLFLSADGTTLWVAEADHNAAAVFRLSAKSADSRAGGTADRLVGRVPVGWYPTAVLADGRSLFVLNGKGDGTGPNPREHQPGSKAPRDVRSYTLAQTSGTLTVSPLPSGTALGALSARVARADGWRTPSSAGRFPPFEHVIYVIKENRTYDQMLGDLPEADGDTSLVYFPRTVTPNQHALAERFGIFDRFFVNAEVSGQGHNWSTAAYASEYLEKTIPSIYSGRGRTYDYEGLNRDTIPDDDVNAPGMGYMWDAALRAGITLRNYGEFVDRDAAGHWVASKANLERVTSSTYPGFDINITDQVRMDAWLDEFRQFEATGTLPQLMILRLPNDHTAGGLAKAPTPRAYVADNDLAVGRLVEAVSRSRYWPNTLIFVLEDDAQDGPDHVDSHRSLMLMISAWNRSDVVHRFANTTDVIATIGKVLKFKPLSQFDYFGRPISGVFAAVPDRRPYVALQPGVSLQETNPENTPSAIKTGQLDLRREDPPNEDLFNRILWGMLKPDRPYPGIRRAFGREP